MSTEVKIPAVGESIVSGLLSVWHKQDGDAVKEGDALFTLETDKVSTEITAERAGVLRIKVQTGAEVKIGEVVALIEEADAKPAPKKAAKKNAEMASVVSPEQAAPEPAAQPDAGSARLLPSEGAMPGVGSQGGSPSHATEQPTPTSTSADARTERKRLSPIRRKIAAQLVMAQQTAAILTTFNECDMSAVMALRKRLQDDFVKQHGVKLGFMSFFIKAVVKALRETPQVNARMDGDDLILNRYFDIGVAVGTERGLIVPVVRDADKKSFGQIEKDLAAFAQRARDGKIGIDDLQGGVFTISNGGIYGSLLSTPILNPPQSGILGMHKIQDSPVALAGQVVIRPMMFLALSYDHRVVDGKEAVTFLIKVKEAIEEPARLLLGI
jgi:2-oxoglutarate dehydrogenase E2 component (dihydrolipoamide succinyltransferase)